MRRPICAFVIGSILTVSASERVVPADKDPVPDLTDIHAEAVSKVGPRNRTVIGIGEDVKLWIGSFGKSVKPADLTGEITWIVNSNNSVLPVLGETTTLTAGLSPVDATITYEAVYWQPERPVAGAADDKQEPKIPQAAEEVAPYDRLAWSVPAELQQDLNKLDGLRNGRKTDPAKVDRLGAELLEKYEAPKQRALIHYQLAHVHAQSGLLQPQSIIDHAAAALELPLEQRNRLRLFIYDGDAYRVLNRKASFSKRRKLAAMVYLQGLKEALKYGFPEKPPELPTLFRGESDVDRQRQYELRKSVQFQRDMIGLRTILTRQIVSVYARKPSATNELESLAKDALENPDAVKRLTGQLSENDKSSEAKDAHRKK